MMTTHTLERRGLARLPDDAHRELLRNLGIHPAPTSELTPNEIKALDVFVECFHRGNVTAATLDLIRRGLRAVVNETDG